jgi:hypothetical protein
MSNGVLEVSSKLGFDPAALSARMGPALAEALSLEEAQRTPGAARPGPFGGLASRRHAALDLGR